MSRYALPVHHVLDRFKSRQLQYKLIFDFDHFDNKMHYIITKYYIRGYLMKGTNRYLLAVLLAALTVVVACGSSGGTSSPSLDSLVVDNWAFDAANSVWPSVPTTGYTGTISFVSNHTYSGSLYDYGVFDEAWSGTWSISGTTMTGIITADTTTANIGQIMVVDVTLSNNNNIMRLACAPNHYDTWNRK